MDKLVKHGIRMLEIIEDENDFFRNDAKRQADIARAVYDTILRVQMLERKSDHKDGPQHTTALSRALKEFREDWEWLEKAGVSLLTIEEYKQRVLVVLDKVDDSNDKLSAEGSSE